MINHNHGDSDLQGYLGGWAWYKGQLALDLRPIGREGESSLRLSRCEF